jgi:hypothetical protein
VPSKRTSLKQRRGIDAIFEGQKAAQKPAAAPPPDVSQQAVKLTVLLPQYIHWGIEQIQLDERRRSGVKPEKYALAKEAFDLLLAKYGVAAGEKKS